MRRRVSHESRTKVVTKDAILTHRARESGGPFDRSTMRVRRVFECSTTYVL